jgi:hypothetical protein
MEAESLGDVGLLLHTSIAYQPEDFTAFSCHESFKSYLAFKLTGLAYSKPKWLCKTLI